MEILYSFHDSMVSQASDNFYRFLYDKINWDERLLAIKGPRGAGKTTMMLQRIRFDIGEDPSKALYISADHYWFYNNTLAETANSFVQNGGQFLFIDEVHKYPHWSREIKNIYDAFPQLKIVISASSALELYKGEADLSRRLITYDLPGLSFREFLKLSGLGEYPVITLDDIKARHLSIASDIVKTIHPLPLFRTFLQYGYLPFFKLGNEKEYLIKLLNVVNIILDTDLIYIKDYNAGTAYKLKKLLGVIAESAPFQPNISALARKLEVSRDSIYDWLVTIQKARLLNFLSKQGKGTSLLQKPDKIFLENTNLAYALKSMPDKGNIRETFIFNQLINSGHDVYFPETGDFLTGNYIIEAGGKNKPASQNISENYIVAADDIEIGYKNKIPLWLFGFLY